MYKVLVVDDSKFSRKIIRTILEKHKYVVIGEAMDGLDGLDKFKELTPDLVVTDIEMPNLNGVEMIRLIQNLSKTTQIVAVSAVVNSQTTQETTKLGVVTVKKPIKENSLLDAIKLFDS